MKKILLSIVCTVLLAFGYTQYAFAVPFTLDFSLYPSGIVPTVGSEITTQYESWGVNFSSLPGTEALQVTELANFGNIGMVLLPGGPSPERGGTLIINFDPFVTIVGSSLFDVNYNIGPININAFDDSDTLIAQSSVFNDNSWSLSNSIGIAKVEIIGNYFQPDVTPDGWGIFDLFYDNGLPIPVLPDPITPGPNPNNPVPEPATMILFSTGLAGIAGIRLRRKNIK